MASLSRFARARAAWDACMTWGDCIISARTDTQPEQFVTQESRSVIGCLLEINLEMMSMWGSQKRWWHTGLGYSLVDTFVKCQVPNDADDVPLYLQGIAAQLINPLEELQASVGNYMVTVALDLHQTSCLSDSTTFTYFTHPLQCRCRASNL